MHIIGRGERRLRGNTALVCLALTLVVVIAEAAGMLQPMERWMYDRRARYCQFFTPPPTDLLVHLDLDDKSLEDIGGWPWPRTTMAALLDEIGRAKPKAVALDILYSEPQKPSWEPQPDGTFREVDNDAALAESIRRLGCVLVPASLHLDTTPPSKLTVAARETLAGDLELTEDDLVAALKLQGFRDKKTEDAARAEYPSFRREGARLRVTREMDAADAAGQPPPTLDELRHRLLRKTGAATPLARTLVAEYEEVRGIRALRRFNPPVRPDLPALYTPESALVPIPRLSEAARTTAFVDYPPFRDGVVRSVPLFMDFDHRVFPQMGLVLAAMMLDADPLAFRLSASSVVVPGKGAGGGDLVIPVRTLHPEGGGREIPMTLDIPWVGTDDWQRTFPANPHRSINVVYNAVHTREKIVQSNAQLTKAMEFSLDEWDRRDGGHRVADFHAGHWPADDPLAQLGAAKTVVDYFDLDVPEGTKVEDGQDERQRRLIASVNALRQAQAEHPKLAAQLKQETDGLRQMLAGKAVLIGWAATSQVADQKPTSIHSGAPGVTIHGQIVNAILTRQLWRAAPPWVTGIVTALCGVLVALAVSSTRPGQGFVVAVLVATFYALFNGIVLFDWGNLLLGLGGPLTCVGVVWAGGSMTRLVLENIERSRITRRFGSYVDPELVDFVLESDQDIFQGQEREMTVVFTDLKGFTSLSESLGREIIPLLNEFMGLATKVIKRNKGLVNKFLGDGVMFFFNAPRSNPNHAADAVAAVLDLYDMLDEFNRNLTDRGLPKLGMRAGMTTGVMVVGDAGSSERSDYTVLGDLVNLAARLESANKATGTRNMVSERTVELAGPKFLFRPVARLQVVGQTAGVSVYETLGRTETATDEQRKSVALAKAVVDAYVAGHADECLTAVVALEEAFGGSLLTALYREQCDSHKQDPANVKFGGQIVLTSK